jgi:hypothetical protein
VRASSVCRSSRGHHSLSSYTRAREVVDERTSGRQPRASCPASRPHSDRRTQRRRPLGHGAKNAEWRANGEELTKGPDDGRYMGVTAVGPAILGSHFVADDNGDVAVRGAAYRSRHLKSGRDLWTTTRSKERTLRTSLVRLANEYSRVKDETVGQASKVLSACRSPTPLSDPTRGLSPIRPRSAYWL